MWKDFDVELFVRGTFIVPGSNEKVVQEFFTQRIPAGSSANVKIEAVADWQQAGKDVQELLQFFVDGGVANPGGMGFMQAWRSFKPGTNDFVGGTPPLKN